MVRLTIPLLTAASLTPLVSADCSVRGPPQPTVPVKVHLDSNYPLAHNTTLQAHDPNIIRANGAFYSFNGSPGIAIHKSDSLDGPWEDMGRALSGSSIIPKEHNERPWAPTALQNDDGTVYLFYTVSQAGCQDSAIGIATTDDIDGGDWKDHGAIVWTGSGPGTAYEPFANSNAIDAQIFVDPTDKQAYLNYGSYWSGLWQLRLSEDWLAVVGGVKDANATHLAKLPEGQNNIEGAFMSFHDGWYYLWYSRGKCCKWEGVPKSGEYHIRVARSKRASGPFVDKQGVPATKGGGEVVYASNHDGQVFAPGGLGVLGQPSGDVLYYHYLNTSVGLKHNDAYVGYSYLEYDDKGWPIARPCRKRE